MEYLVFQLRAPISAWGETAVGEYRPTANYPSESALIGLLAAALGIDRQNESVHQALYAGYGFAVGVQSAGGLLRDYHTAQVPGRAALKGNPHHSRRDELNLPKGDVNTILSTRDYRQDAACLVVVHAKPIAPYRLEDLVKALQKPKYVLYLGRKSCPPSVPLFPQSVDAGDIVSAMEMYRQILNTTTQIMPEEIDQVVWGEGIEAGIQHDLQVVRKDRLLSRQNWQFGDRYEFVAFIGGQQCTSV